METKRRRETKVDKAHEEASREDRYREAERIVATGRCPWCGSALKRNLSLSGWWQCEQYGAVTHRRRPNDPACDWQTFTR